jgi:hypothetical protein
LMSSNSEDCFECFRVLDGIFSRISDLSSDEICSFHELLDATPSDGVVLRVAADLIATTECPDVNLASWFMAVLKCGKPGYGASKLLIYLLNAFKTNRLALFR